MARRIEPNKYRVYVYKGKKRFLEKDCRSPEQALAYARDLASEHEKVYACIEYYPEDQDEPAEYELLTITNGSERHGESSPERQRQRAQQEAAAAAQAKAAPRQRAPGERRTLKEILFESTTAAQSTAVDKFKQARRKANWFSVLFVLVLVYFVLQTIQQVI